MKCYYLQVFFGGIPVSISAVKNEKFFFQSVSNAIYKTLPGVHFMIRVYNEGIVLEGDTIPERFLDSVIPFVYQNRKLELRVFPKVFIAQ
jgi:hypothetical protein